MLDPKSSSSGWLLDLSALVICLVGSSFIQHEVSLRIYLIVIRFWSNGSKRICTLLYCTTSQTSLWDKLCRLVIKLRSAPIENKQDLGKAYPQFLPSRGSSGWRSLPSHHSLVIDWAFFKNRLRAPAPPWMRLLVCFLFFCQWCDCFSCCLLAKEWPG